MVLINENVYKLESLVGNYVETFLEELHSENTAIAYRGDFSRFIKTVFNKEIHTITKKEIESVDYDMIIAYRKELNLAPSTINRHINSIKSILFYLKGRKVIDLDLDFFAIIKELKKQTNEIPHMPIEVVHEFIEQAKEERHNATTKANLIMFAVDSGLRLSELLELKTSDFTETNDHYLLTGYGKGNKKYTDSIAKEVVEQLFSDMIPNEENRIFYPLSEKNAKDMMVRIRKKLGYDKEKYSFHSLRKTSVTYTHDLTGSLLVAQRKANHSSPNTTTIYVENRELEITGYFSTQNIEKDLYKNVEHEELLNALASMPTEFLQILNNKLSK